MTKPLCVYHGNCADGFTSAWVVNKRFNGQVEFFPGVYGEAPPKYIKDRDVILVDFSYKRGVLDLMANAANSITVLDHHKTAQEDLSELVSPQSLFYPGLSGIFDMDRSGAQITWDYFFSGVKRPLIVDYVGDRDLWRFKLPDSREVNAYIFSFEYTFENWDAVGDIIGHNLNLAILGGAAIERKHHRDIRELTQRTMAFRIGGMTVPVVNLPYTMASDAAHVLALQSTDGIGATYYDRDDARVFSLRSLDTGPDVSAIAKKYGGGGHAHAAGFQAPVGWLGDPT